MATHINLDDEIDCWRWACPNGHRSWEATIAHFWCSKCAKAASQAADAEPEFYELRNRSIGNTVERVGEIGIRMFADPDAVSEQLRVPVSEYSEDNSESCSEKANSASHSSSDPPRSPLRSFSRRSRSPEPCPCP